MFTEFLRAIKLNNRSKKNFPYISTLIFYFTRQVFQEYKYVHKESRRVDTP